MLEKIIHSYIKGIACAIPDNKIPNAEYYNKFGKPNVDKIAKMTGVYNRYIALESQCTSDLCYFAAKELMKELSWSSESVDGIIFVSQTPDYVMPATACFLQNKLGLRNDVFAFDINLGCSGYVYGLWLALTLASFPNKRILLLVGDTLSKVISPEDRATILLFGDASSATAVEYCKEEIESVFSLNTDGDGYRAILVPAGSFRNRSIQDFTRHPEEDGFLRSAFDIHMNGTEVFNFTISKVPDTINNLIKELNIVPEEIDYFIPHQANLFMMNHIVNKIMFPEEKMVITLNEFGNTSSASIPISIVNLFTNHDLSNKEFKLLLAGFGVGLSWGVGLITLKAIKCLPVIRTNQLISEDL